MMLNLCWPGTVWVSITSGTSLSVILAHFSLRNQDVGFLTLVDQWRAAGVAPVLVSTSPVDGVCGVCTTVFLGVFSVVAGVTRFVEVIAWAMGAVTGAVGAGLTKAFQVSTQV